MSVLRNILPGIALLFTCVSVRAQIPTQCLEIERILVDACIDLSLCPTAQEGQNEMVSFRTGPIAIALTELAADWPNNSWNGLVQNPTTAALTTTMNASIVGCGLLIEPPGGIIPPGSRVLLVSSTDVCAAANSFANLNDTLYIIFQAPGNTSGHFANQNNGTTISAAPTGGSSLRTLVLIYLPTNCSDTATYDRELLPNIFGTYGGSSAENDGATAVFTWPGVPQVSYVNFGCQAPFVPNTVTIDQFGGSLCGGTGSVVVAASPTGPFVDGVWSGGTGTFSDPNAIGTSYTAGAGDLGDVVLTFTANFSCGPAVSGSITIPAGNAPTVTITANGPLVICPGQSLTLTASGADTYEWSTQEFSESIVVSAAGTYSVTGTSACGQGSASVDITAASPPTVIITPDGPTSLCPGESVTLTASGADSYLWDTQEATPLITVTQPGTYSVTGTNACGTAGAQIDIIEAPGPTVIITPDGPTALCPGQSLVLTASGADTYLWNTLDGTPSITVTQPGVFSVTGTNSCGEGTAQIEITAGITPVVTIDIDGPNPICPGDSVILMASGADTYLWSTQETSDWIVVDAAGTYTVTGTNGCGSDEEQVVIDVIAISASFTADVTTGMAPLDVVFTNTSTPATALSGWVFDDGEVSVETSPTHTFTADGTYNVVLTITDQGCISSASLIIFVGIVPADTGALFVPNIFTPNGDHVNDQVMVRGGDLESLHMSIFNRWGELVGELRAPRDAWDARTFAGEPVPDGTYFYVLKAEGRDGKSYSLNGTITLMR